MPRYQVVEGFHHEPAKRESREGQKVGKPVAFDTYTKGDVVESERDLIAIFPNKFRLVPEDQGIGQQNVSKVRCEQVAALIQTGAYDEGDRFFLEHLTDDGFRRVQTAIARRQEQETVATEAPVNPNASQVAQIRSRFGTNVTDQFQLAYDEGFCVFVNGQGKHQVTKRDKPTKALNVEALDREQVEPFIKGWLEDFNSK